MYSLGQEVRAVGFRGRVYESSDSGLRAKPLNPKP